MLNSSSFAVKVTRIVAAVMIFMCHTVFLFGEKFSFTAQFFNIGVDIFLLISAFLFSAKQEINTKIGAWYKKRFFRISVPYYWLLIIVAVLCILFKVNFEAKDFVFSILYLQGITENYLPGGGHLWYLTAIMIAYLVTPMLYKIRKMKRSFKLIFFLLLSVMYTMFVFSEKDILTTISANVIEYIIFFFVVPLLNKIVSGKQHIKFVVFCTVLLAAFCVFKIVFNVLWDNTELYLKFLVPLTDTIIGIAIFYDCYKVSLCCFSIVRKSERLIKIINHFDKISFEFYLVHYFLITFPVNLVFKINPFVNFIIILIFSYILSCILYLMSKITFEAVELWKQKH